MSSKAPWIIGGLALAGLGLFALSKKKTTPLASGTPGTPGTPGKETPPTDGKGAPTGPGMTTPAFKMTPVQQDQLWYALTLVNLSAPDASGDRHIVPREPTDPSLPGASVVAEKNEAGMPVYVLAEKENTTVRFLAPGAAAPRTPWAIFLDPKEWQTVAARTKVSPVDIPKLPTTGTGPFDIASVPSMIPKIFGLV